MTSNFIDTPRGKFHYRSYGDRDGIAVILLHGWPQSCHCWHEMLLHMKQDLHYITPDLRGMGDSNHALDIDLYAKDKMAMDIVSIADALGIERFYLVGHDWGAGVAQELVLNYPDRVIKFAMFNMAIINNQVGQMKAYAKLGKRLFYPFWYQFFLNLKELPEALITGREEVWVRYFLKPWSSKVIPESAIAEYVRCYQIPNTVTTTANIYRNLSKDMERYKTYFGKKIQPESKIIFGAKDPVIIKEYLEGVEDCFEKVSIEYIEDASHFVMDEQPEESARILEGFLRG